MAEEAFKKFEIVPEVVSHAPKNALKIVYEGAHELYQGTILTPRQVKDQPHVSWDAEKDALYTLALVDPDAPSRTDPNKAEFEHWLVVNIPENDIEKGDTLSGYFGAGPPPNTGLHRYIFLLFKQSGPIADKIRAGKTAQEMIAERKNHIKDFVEKHHLEGPIAGNFFQAEFDDYVLELHKQLGHNKE